MNYRETIEFLFSALPMFQRIGQAAYKANLDNTLALDHHFNHPHRNFKTIHIAGTNGKGSVSHMLAAILQKAGYRTGLYTSPHLLDFRERIRINGNMIPENEVVRFVNENMDIISQIRPSFFEMTVAMAFEYFSREKVDIAVVETGMGGRLDSTNIITPLVSVITNIGLDHTQFLGDTPEKIAAEKAGIVKPQVPVVIGEYQEETYPVFKEYAERNNSSLSYGGRIYETTGFRFAEDINKQIITIRKEGEIVEYSTDLQGNYQGRNLPAVLLTIDVLRSGGLTVTEKAVHEGVGEVKEITGLRGRWDTLGHNPLIVCDTAHNREGLLQVVEQIKKTRHKKLHFVIGLVDDKDIQSVLSALPVEAEFYFTRASIPRALDHEQLYREGIKAGLKGKAYSSVDEAFKAAKGNARKEDMIFIGGSTFVVADVLCSCDLQCL